VRRYESQHCATNNKECHEYCDNILSLLEDLCFVLSDMSVTNIDAEQRNRVQDHQHDADNPDETGTDHSLLVGLPGKILQVESNGKVHVCHQSQHGHKIENNKKPFEEARHDCQSLSLEPTRRPKQVKRQIDGSVQEVYN